MGFPGDTLEERMIRCAIRFGFWDEGPAWDAASSVYQELLKYLMNWPPNTCTTPPVRLYCGVVEADIFEAGETATGLTRGGGESAFDYAGRLLNWTA